VFGISDAIVALISRRTLTMCSGSAPAESESFLFTAALKTSPAPPAPGPPGPPGGGAGAGPPGPAGDPGSVRGMDGIWAKIEASAGEGRTFRPFPERFLPTDFADSGLIDVSMLSIPIGFGGVPRP